MVWCNAIAFSCPIRESLAPPTAPLEFGLNEHCLANEMASYGPEVVPDCAI